MPEFISNIFPILQTDSLLTTREKAKNEKLSNLQQALLVLQHWNLTTSEIKEYLLNYDSFCKQPIP